MRYLFIRYITEALYINYIDCLLIPSWEDPPQQRRQVSPMILWSIRTFWYKGSAEIKDNNMFGKRPISLKSSSLKLKV